MRAINLDRDWWFREGTYGQSLKESDFGEKMNLPHDYMIKSDVNFGMRKILTCTRLPWRQRNWESLPAI